MNSLWDALEALMEWGGTRKDITLLILSGVALATSMAELALPLDPAWAAILLCGLPITLEALIGLFRDRDITADVLVALALWASVAIGETFAAGEIAFIMQLGAFLEERTVAKARAGIARLVKLTPRTARRLLPDGRQETIPAGEVAVGDHLLVKPGESVTVDGLILSGNTSVDESVMTGEPVPRDKGAGDAVISGSVNRFGVFTMEAKKACADSSLQRMVRLVETADAGRAKIVRLADRWAVWIVAGAALIATLAYLLTGEFLRAVTVLVVFCPCALVLATPTAIMAAIGNAARHGFLVREGAALERLAEARRIVFDKTGTLTEGRPQVTASVSAVSTLTSDRLLLLAASAESLSEHPLARAIVRRGEEAGGLLPVEEASFAMTVGKGVEAMVAGDRILAGTLSHLAASGIDTSGAEEQAKEYLREGKTVIHIALGKAYAGFLVLSDELRPESAGVVSQLKEANLRPVLLTGDRESTATAVAGGVGIDEYRAQCLPETKLAYLKERQAKGEALVMVGDGINDAPALKAADVGIAMGGVGSDIAVDAADIVLVHDRVKELPFLLALSRHTMKTIRRNIAFSLGLNLLAVTLAVLGLLTPVTGALVHNAGSVLVIASSALLLRWGRERKGGGGKSHLPAKAVYQHSDCIKRFL